MNTSRMSTHFGQTVDLLNPDPRAITLADISYALGRIVRFSGHGPLTVAEHSVLVARMMEADNFDECTVLHALLHDAHEAYIGDVTRPVVTALPRTHVGLSALKDRVQSAIYVALGVPPATPRHRLFVAHYDRVSLTLEAFVGGLMRWGDGAWSDTDWETLVRHRNFIPLVRPGALPDFGASVTRLSEVTACGSG